MAMNGKKYSHKGEMKSGMHPYGPQTYASQDTPNSMGQSSDARSVDYEKAAKAQPPFSNENVTSVEQPYGSKMKSTQQRKY